ncbi:MAG: iron-containing alcohol dehydrogenase [Nocardiopsaceae bacterium]|jgi:glycerol-1-phosphate dehydrogenase [NAD(P)+]|nr:iron-containing alcohol dehydrogenase [Nocardiopsaceae bacterium]
MTQLQVPLDLGALRATLAGEELHPLELAELHVGAGALGRLGDLVSRVARDSADVVVLAAATPIRAGGADLRDVIEAALAPGSSARWVVLGPADGSVHADENTVAEARRAADGAGCVIGAGSGTICDIAKAAAPEGLPLVIVQTAASVNGYADPFSVLLRSGVKRTTPTRWPDALVVDTDILKDAPPRLNLAGLGDMSAIFTATADWFLAALLRADGPPYDAKTAGLVRPHGELMLRAGPTLAGDPAGLAGLAKLLTLSGIAMGVTGGTAPASGMEHAVSHLLEMAATASGATASLHGEQVGVASVVAAATWAHVRDKIARDGLDRRPRLPDPDTTAARITTAFAALDPSGAMGAECLADYAVKLKLLAAADDPLAPLRDAWEECDAAFERILIEPGELAAALRAAGLPVRFAGLPTAVDDDQARWAVANCALQRRRLGVADLAMLLGAWEDEDVSAVLEAAEAAAAAAGGLP